MPLWCTCLFCIAWLRNVQRFITRAEPLYNSLNPLFCHVFAATVLVCIRSMLLWSIKSHDVDISVFRLLLYLQFKPWSHWKIPNKQNCVACRFPHWKSLYHSPIEISGNSHWNFWSNGKRPWFDYKNSDFNLNHSSFKSSFLFSCLHLKAFYML